MRFVVFCDFCFLSLLGVVFVVVFVFVVSFCCVALGFVFVRVCCLRVSFSCCFVAWFAFGFLRV